MRSMRARYGLAERKPDRFGCQSVVFGRLLFRLHRSEVYYGPARPPVNSSSVGSCLRLLVLLWLLLQASAAAQHPEIPPPTPPATSAPQFQNYLDHTYGWQ